MRRRAAGLETDIGSADSFRAMKKSWSKLDIGTTNIETALTQAAAAGHASVILVSDGYETAGDFDSVIPLLKRSGTRIFPLLPEQRSDGQDTVRISHLHSPLVVPRQKKCRYPHEYSEHQ